MDNVGYGDLGINGGGLLAGAPTPNMDRLGREGLQLLSAYSQPSCTPSRCTLLTGRLPMRHGQLHPSFAGQAGSWRTRSPSPSSLSKAGYVTQGMGKWHCGEDEASQPQNVGFDDFYGFLGWSGLYTDWQDEDFAPEFALSPERQAYVQTVPFNPNIVHGSQGSGGRGSGRDHHRGQRPARRKVRGLLGRLHQEDGQERQAVLPVPLHRAATTSRTTPTPSTKASRRQNIRTKTASWRWTTSSGGWSRRSRTPGSLRTR